MGNLSKKYVPKGLFLSFVSDIKSISVTYLISISIPVISGGVNVT